MVRQQQYERAATKVASLMGTFAHEMSLEDYGTVESTVFSRVFALVHVPRSQSSSSQTTNNNNNNHGQSLSPSSLRNNSIGHGPQFVVILISSVTTNTSTGATAHRMAGLAALTALLDGPSADEERKGIKFAYTLSQALRQGAGGDFEFLQATAQALGRMAQTTPNIFDFDEYEVTRVLEWLHTERSDRRYVSLFILIRRN